MSRAKTKRKRKLQRAQAAPQMGSMQSFNTAAQALMAQMQAQAKQSTGTIFSPGLPLSPQPGVTPDHTPRQYSFPLAYNTSGSVDRTLGRPNIPSFAQLRLLSKMYSGITLPERVWLDMIPGLSLKIGLTPEMKAQGYDDKDFQPEIKKYLTFFEKPDKRLNYHSWLREAIRSQTQIDEVYAYKRRTRKGELYALELVDGATVKPLIDDWGRIPEHPEPAYQQYPWGIPGDYFTSDELIHYQETPQDDSPYGFSRVERFLLEVNTALRKGEQDLSFYTEGNVPQGIMEVPADMNWTADEIDKYEKLWNSLIAGNTQQRVRVKFTHPGMKYTRTDAGDINTDFNYFLYKISCGVYGISLADIGFVEDIHKSSDKGQQNMLYRRTLGPIVTMYAKMFFTDVIHDDFNDDRFEASFIGFEEEEDTLQKANTFAVMAGVGAIQPADIAHEMGYPDVPKTGPFILPKGGQPIFLKDYEEGSDLRKAQSQAMLQGQQFAAQNPGGVLQDDDEEEDESDESTQQAEKGTNGSGTAKNDKPDSSGKVAKEDEQTKSSGTNQGSSKGKTAQNNGRGNASEKVDTGSKSADNSKSAKSISRAVESDLPQTGMMIAFMLDPETAQQLALPDGEDPSDMHVTLAYMGDINDEISSDKGLTPYNSPFGIRGLLETFASESRPLQGKVSGIGRFTGVPDGEPTPVYASVDVPGLAEFRTKLVEQVQALDYFVDATHGFTPHITLAYIPANEPMPVESVEDVPLTFDRLCLAIGDERRYFSLGDENGPREAHGAPSNINVSRGEESESDLRAEYRRWRIRACDDTKRGRSIRPFESDIIPAQERDLIRNSLERCESVDDVRAIFKAAQERDTSFLAVARERNDPGDLQTKSRIDWRNAPLA